MVTRGGFKGWSGGSHPPYFLQSLVFCNHFVEAETVLFKVELIINNAPLTFIYPNTIQTCLTPSHLLFGRQRLYSSNTTAFVPTLNCISIHFWDRGRHDYVANLCETQRTSKLNIKR